MKKILYIDACIHRESSRTEQLAQAYLKECNGKSDSILETIILEELKLKPLDEERLLWREQQIKAKDYTSPYFSLAHSFAAADELIIAAPYWDMSFPSTVKLFFEHICINGLTFRYIPQGYPEGLTHIKKAAYITTAGGYIGDRNFGYEYVHSLLKNLFGIATTKFYSAEGLDIAGNNPDSILADAILSLETD